MTYYSKKQGGRKLKKLIPSFLESLDTLSETAQDLLEIRIDTIFEDGMLKDIPIVGTVVSLCKFSLNLRERNLLKQTIAFIQAFNNGTINEEALLKYRENILPIQVKLRKNWVVFFLYLIQNSNLLNQNC